MIHRNMRAHWQLFDWSYVKLRPKRTADGCLLTANTFDLTSQPMHFPMPGGFHQLPPSRPILSEPDAKSSIRVHSDQLHQMKQKRLTSYPVFYQHHTCLQKMTPTIKSSTFRLRCSCYRARIITSTPTCNYIIELWPHLRKVQFCSFVHDICCKDVIHSGCLWCLRWT
jgi:hypothetical protein